MTTVTQIITDAFRQSNLIGIGATPTSNEQTEALRYLNRLVRSVFGHEVGEPLESMPIGSENISRPSGYPWYNNTPDNEWFVPKNTRLVFNLDQPLDVYLHPEPNDGSRFAVIDSANNVATFPVTVHGNGRRIEGATSVVLNTNGVNSEWFYREDLGEWVKYAPLEADDTFPFPEEFDDFFITALALRINPSFGTTMDDQSQSTYLRARRQLVARYAQQIFTMSEPALWRLSKMVADRDRWTNEYYLYNPSSLFSRGWPQ